MYDHKSMENKWKDCWYKDNIYEAVDFDNRPKKYILAELPYPSGKYLHVGHMMRYTVPEIYARYLRMKGYNVLFPMGWDSFGLPAETFAIKTGSTPQKVIAEAIPNYREAMKNMGYSIDWNREINTADPKYYKWTQWIFLKLWENGLVEQKELPVWWCEELGVLADEEVLPDDKGPTGKKSERDGYPVYRRNLKQWVLKITEYADKLLEGLNEVDFVDSVKSGQINWIGKSEGTHIFFPVENSDEKLKCFTTRIDTIFGVTFLALAPEHSFAQKIAETNIEAKKYIEEALKKSELQRQEEEKDKTGIFSGIYATNPLNNQKVPIWIADYVLGQYGTGCIMGVPGHDTRDYAFARKYDLKIVEVIKPNEISKETPFTGYGVLINSENFSGKSSEEAIKELNILIQKNNLGEKAVTYKLRDQIWSRQRYWGEPIPLVYKQDGTIEADYNLPLVLPDLEEFLPEKGEAPLRKLPDWYNTKAKDGTPAVRETDTMPTWGGSNWYYMRYIDPNNDETFADYEKLKYWMPVDKYFGDAGHTTAHLLYTRFWYRFLYDQGLVPTKEPVKWRMSGGLLLGEDKKKMSKSRPEYVVNPKDVLDNYGADAARVYLAFIGPYDETYPWNPNGIKACYRFVKNVYELKNKVKDNIRSEKLERAYHKMLKAVTLMAEDLKMNTAVAEFMKFLNETKPEEFIDKNLFLNFLKVLAPFAPFVTEELWQEFNGFSEWKKETSIHLQAWPVFDEAKTADSKIKLGIQINGKLRSEILIEINEDEESVKSKVLADPKVIKNLEGKEIKKFIYIPAKIISLVV